MRATEPFRVSVLSTQMMEVRQRTLHIAAAVAPLRLWHGVSRPDLGKESFTGTYGEPRPARKEMEMKESSAAVNAGSRAREFIRDFHGVRYQTKGVSRAVAFYSDHLGFKVEHQQLPAFATISLGPLHILLSGPGASGSRPMSDGQRQEPGGWNRVVLRVSDLEKMIAACNEAGLRFRNEMEVGPAGKQIQLLDPDGNPIELFEPAR
jgi:glyoxylase I family protein